jgi:hypothetical protein
MQVLVKEEGGKSGEDRERGGSRGDSNRYNIIVIL